MWPPKYLQNIDFEILANPYVLCGLGAVVLVLFLWLALRRGPKALIAYQSESGEVMVSRRALQELIQQCCEQLGEVGRARAIVTVSRKSLHTRVELKVHPEAKLRGISGYLQEQISQLLTENLGLENVGKIDVVVVGVLKGPLGDLGD